MIEKWTDGINVYDIEINEVMFGIDNVILPTVVNTNENSTEVIIQIKHIYDKYINCLNNLLKTNHVYCLDQLSYYDVIKSNFISSIFYNYINNCLKLCKFKLDDYGDEYSLDVNHNSPICYYIYNNAKNVLDKINDHLSNYLGISKYDFLNEENNEKS